MSQLCIDAPIQRAVKTTKKKERPLVGKKDEDNSFIN